jgi:hypothetical protein
MTSAENGSILSLMDEPAKTVAGVVKNKGKKGVMTTE